MARSPRNHTHYIARLPLSPNTWPLILLLYIYIDHPNPSLCVCPPPPSPQFLRGGVCVCGKFWPAQNPQFESESIPSRPAFLWKKNIQIITNWTQNAHLSFLANVNCDQTNLSSSTLQGRLLVVVDVTIYGGVGRLPLSPPTPILSLYLNCHF